MPAEPVRAWAETVAIPTYRVGEPEKQPLFLEKRVYQGSRGAVYPYPVIERIFDEKVDRRYTAVFLENQYLKVMVLPELGGRVQMALDKTNGYPFIYYNRVIKPALVGLAGPWISGGIEFNWPQHHRPTTFSPLEWRITEEPDGSRTVWCAEIERMSGMKGMHGIRLSPGRAVLEVRVQLYNRTGLPQTFLWWANPAVHAGENLQSVFPPDVRAVMDHGKRAVSSFPIATGVYYHVDYSPGTDISWYKNLPAPTSFMAYHSDFDFIGSYDHGRQAGMLHVADHHLVPGKKQWTWGCGDFGRAWDRQLTDEDGPYVELMCGAYSDNQPDFSWIMPGEEKTFTQTFMPYKRIGPPKNATAEAAINLEIQGEMARIGAYCSRPRRVRVELLRDGNLEYQKAFDLSPEQVLLEEIPVSGLRQPQQLTLRLVDGQTELVSFTPLPEDPAPLPPPATAARPPREIATSEELYLNGLHLEQYRHATYAPEPYYEEGLRRDPLDSRCNNALGLLLYRRGKFGEAEAYFRRALERLTSRNPNPYDGESHYNLGLSLFRQGRLAEARRAFFKATWNAAWAPPAFYELACLACRQGDYPRALELAEKALRGNSAHHKARHLKTAALRRLERKEQALQEARLSLSLDPMEYGALWESHLLAGDDLFEKLAGEHLTPYVEVALDYAHAGLFDEAADLLLKAPGKEPCTLYSLGWVYSQAGKQRAAVQAHKQAASLPLGFYQPNSLESVLALEDAMYLNPMDAHAPYLLGNFWYAHQRYDEAIECWEASRAIDPSFPTTHRNLGLAYYNKRHDPGRALVSLEIAFALDPTDARLFYELDQLEKRLNRPPKERLESLEAHAELVEQRDDLSLERVTLLNILDRHDEALDLLKARTFHPWEGGEGKVAGQWTLAWVEKARRLIRDSRYAEALRAIEQARVLPPNLGEGKLHGKRENDIFYVLGCAWEALREEEQARQAFEKAATGSGEEKSGAGSLEAPRYYYDQPPEMIFYQGLANYKLDEIEAATAIFQRMLDWGAAHLNDPVSVDYFAVSLPDFLVFEEDLDRRHRAHCHYLMALGSLGLGEMRQAESQFRQVLALDASHVGAHVFRRLLAA